MNTRRQFLIRAPLGFLAATAACRGDAPASDAQATPPSTPGAPPAFGTGAVTGPAVTPATFAEAEKLMQVTMTAAEREQAAASWRTSLAPYLERRTGPRKVPITDVDSPATIWNPAIPGVMLPNVRDHFARSKATGAPLPSSDDAIAFAPVTQLSRWIESRKLSSERLTNIYLARIDRLNPKINAIITVTRDHALARARQADREIASGKYRGPLHGIPYGVKDLLDTKDIPTTYGAEPFRNRVPKADSAVVRRLDEWLAQVRAASPAPPIVRESGRCVIAAIDTMGLPRSERRLTLAASLAVSSPRRARRAGDGHRVRLATSQPFVCFPGNRLARR